MAQVCVGLVPLCQPLTPSRALESKVPSSPPPPPYLPTSVPDEPQGGDRAESRRGGGRDKKDSYREGESKRQTAAVTHGGKRRDRDC